MSLNSVLRNAAISPTPSLAKTIELDVKLQQRVCQMAGLRHEDLPRETKSWLEHAVHDWITTRSVSDTKMKVAANMLRKQGVPLSTSGSKGGGGGVPKKSMEGSKQQHRTTPPPASTGAAAQWEQSPPRSRTTEPQDANGLAAEVDRIRFGGAKSVASVGPLRPEVLRRMQRLNADREFTEALAREAREEEARKAEQLAERSKQSLRVREEMARAEQMRIQALKEKEEARRHAHDEIALQLAEARADERDQKLLRAQRIAHERHLLQEQLDEKRRAKLRAKTLDQEENEALRRYQEEKEHMEVMKEFERAALQREDLLEAQRLDRERAIAANAKKRQPKEPVTALDTRAFHTEKSAELIRKRMQLQELAAAQYAAEQQRKSEAVRELEQREQQSVARKEAFLQQRKEQEEQQKLRRRADFVSSLEIEIAVAKTKKKLEKDEKVALRREEDKTLEAEKRRAQEAHERDLLEKQRKREKMEAELNDRMAQRMQPSPIKI